MFIFTTETIFKNFEVLMEEHTEIFNKLREVLKTNFTGKELSDKVRPILKILKKYQ